MEHKRIWGKHKLVNRIQYTNANGPMSIKIEIKLRRNEPDVTLCETK